MSPSNTYFIKASVDPSGLFAVCSYFYDKAGQQPVPAGPLSIAQEAGGCQFGQAQGSDLVLLGASFKTLGGHPTMSDSNFCPADAAGMLTISMPTAKVVTKGVVLLFSNPGLVNSLYASSDPEVINDN